MSQMSQPLYWTGIVLAAILASIAIWLRSPSNALFPGLMALFSFYLLWTTQYSRLMRENPDVLVHVGSIGLISRDDRHGCEYLVCVSNPGVLAGSLTGIDWLKDDKKADSSGGRWEWQSLYPVLGSRHCVASRSDLPAPLLPGGLIAVYRPGPSGSLPDSGYLRLTYQLGGYKEKTGEWPAKDLKGVGKTNEVHPQGESCGDQSEETSGESS